jgi:hypothetical protein
VFFIAFVEQSVSIFSRVKVSDLREFRRTGGCVDQIKLWNPRGKALGAVDHLFPSHHWGRSSAEQGRERENGKDEEAKLR